MTLPSGEPSQSAPRGGELVDLPPRGARAPPPAARGLSAVQERLPAGRFFEAFVWDPLRPDPRTQAAGEFFGSL